MTPATMTPAPASASEAMAMVHAGLGFLATTDAAALGSAVQADMLRGLEEANSAATAARISVLGAFTAGQGYAEDGTYSPRAWLAYHTAITDTAASGHTGWVRRARAHPRVHAALIARQVSEPWARTICQWSGRLPRGSQDAADGILLAAAVSGLGLPDLAALAAEMRERSRQHAPDDPGRDGDPGQAPDPVREDGEGRGQEDPGEDGFEDRLLRLGFTFGGAAVLHGDLTPECAQVVKTVLDALSARAGQGDDRSHEQRYHDALQEAMTRLVAAGLVPQRAGQPVKVLAHATIADLMLLEGSDKLRDAWTRQARLRWAGYRARTAAAGTDEGMWLEGDAAAAIGCDALITPLVSGHVNPSAFADLVKLAAALDKIYRRQAAAAQAWDDARAQARDDAARRNGPDAGDDPDAAGTGTLISQEALEEQVIAKAVDLLSGPGGLASVLRQQQLGGRLATVSLPLDHGATTTIPGAIRNLIRHRDRHCRWPGCRRPAAACEIHHVRHSGHGGHTSVTNCILLCRYHHQVAIHRQGWTLKLNPDGTTTAWNKDRSRILHSHSPPARTG